MHFLKKNHIAEFIFFCNMQEQPLTFPLVLIVHFLYCDAVHLELRVKLSALKIVLGRFL